MKLRDLFRGPIRDASLSQGGIDRQVIHLSTPPKIGSSIPRLAIMSAT